MAVLKVDIMVSKGIVSFAHTNSVVRDLDGWWFLTVLK